MLVSGPTDVASWPLEAGDRCDLAMVEDLARLQLHAARMGCTIRVEGGDARLAGLLDLVGLGAVIEVGRTTPGGSGIEAIRQPEGGEQVEVEEVVVTDDPVP